MIDNTTMFRRLLVLLPFLNPFQNGMVSRRNYVRGALLLLALSFTVTAQASQTDIPGPAGSSRFGIEVKVLPNGNFVVTDPGYSVPGGAANVGAVYLYDASTLQLISRLTGSTPNDEVGAGGIVVLANGNFVVSSASWDDPAGSNANAGAVTWCSGTTGCNGVVSASNSLIGSQTGEHVGRGTVTRLTNGHYVVSSPSWNGAAGAVTWGNGATGTVGVVSSTNSLVGAGVGAITELSNGNYVASNIYWDNSSTGAMDAGAVTWCNGQGGTVGQVSSSNSLIGSTANDNVGRVKILTNGNYVVSAPSWDNPTGQLANVGAVTWASGNGGTFGPVTSANSLIGGTAGDLVGQGSFTSSKGVTPLTNGNYVVSSPLWDNPAGAIADAGAVTWANGNGGTAGLVSSSNSLIGGTTDDKVGGTASFLGERGDVTALTNGNYVVSSCSWNNPVTVKIDVGAITWGNGNGGTIGLITPGNSLLGSTNHDKLGSGGVTPLTNGNYVISSAAWDNPAGPVPDAGAATWGNGSGGTAGVITPDTSLVGGTAGDHVGAYVTALPNGNYVVSSASWRNPAGSTANVGAATWANGNGSTVGLVSPENSLVGSTENDRVGGLVTALTNGHYVVRSPGWTNPVGPAAEAGAVTWGNGSGGTTGLVSPTNSLVGGTSSDRVGSTAFEDTFADLTVLSNGNYVVTSLSWDDPAGSKDAGAVTWGNGNGGTAGLVNSSNSLIGDSTGDTVGGSAYNGFDGAVPFDAGGVVAFANGNYVVDSPFWSNPNGPLHGAVSLGNGTSGTAGFITSTNSVVGTNATSLYNSDIPNFFGNTFSYDATRNRLVVGRPASNIVSVFSPETASGTFFTVSGRIANLNNSGIPNVLITTVVTTSQGSQTQTTQTDANGEYSIPNLPAGGNYTITPSKANFIFSPGNRLFNSLAADQTAANFLATAVVTIRGRVTVSGAPLSGVTMTISDGAAAVTTTDANGDYAFINLPAPDNFTVTPSKANYSFTPVNLMFSAITVDQNSANFNATLNKYTISGNISSGGTPLSGVALNLSGSQTATTGTNANGDYSFTNLDGSGNYTVTPSKVNYSFSPSSLTFNNLSANQTSANFVATRTGYSIAVHVGSATRFGVTGVTVTVTGPTTATGITNSVGHVTFDNLQPGGNYTVTPSQTGFRFNPPNRAFNNLISDQSAEFERITIYKVSGRVADAKGNGIPGVTIIVGVQGDPPPTGPGITTTDASGNYDLDFAPIGFPLIYAVYPSKAGYSFSPILFRNAAGVDIPGISLGLFRDNQPVTAVANFLATHSISGRVTDSNGGVSGVTMTLSGQGSGTATTDVNGNYSFLNLPAGNDYTITPSKAGLAFAPASRTFTSLGANQPGVYFAAQAVHAGFEPVVLTTDQAEIKTWTFQGKNYAYVKLMFPKGGYSVSNWGQAVKSANDFATDATIERSTGASVQAVTTTAQIYDLGPLTDGNYTFTFKNSGVLVKSQAFTVSSAVLPSNPIDNAREFVRQQYRDFLNREADQAGEDYWTDNITKCLDPARRPANQTEAQCTLRQKEMTSGAFFLSPEFQYTGYYVYRMYQGALGRPPKLSEFTSDAQLVASGIIVTGQLSAAKINQNKRDFAAQFVHCTDATKYRCDEFRAIYDGLNSQQFVDKVFQLTGVNASAADRSALVNGLNGGTETRATVLQKVVDGINVISEGNQQFTTSYGQAFYDQQLARAFVQMEYFGYLKRDPDDAGYAFWLGKLNQFGGNFVNAEMVLAFITSPEYRARFGQP